MAYADDMRQIARRRALAERLMAQSMHPQAQQSGRFLVGPTPFSALANLGEGVYGASLERRADREEKQARETERARLAQALQRISGQATAPAGAAPDPQQSAALEVINQMPLEQAQTVVGRSALEQLFPKLQKIDAGNEILLTDSRGNVVRRMPKGATPDAQLGADVSTRGQDLSAQTTRRGQDLSSQTAMRGQDVTMRGQDVSAETTRRGQDIAADVARTKLPNSPARIQQTWNM